MPAKMILKAYRKLSKSITWLLNQEPGAEEKYKEVQLLWNVSDPQKRAQYDQFNPAGANGGFS